MSNYAHPEVLIDSQWLVEHLNDPYVRVVEVDTSPEPYKNAHIPGAVFWNIFEDLLLSDLRINPDSTAMERLLSRSGISNKTTVVAYGGYPSTSAWIFWLLKLFGHDRVLVLNGGYQKWLLEGCPVSENLSNFESTQYSAKSPNPSLRVLSDEIQASIGTQGRVLLDVRTIKEYKGEHFFTKPPEESELAGHIPTSVHLEHLLTMNKDGTFKTNSELQTVFNEHGITTDLQVFPYCTIGARSAYIWFVLKYLLGYPQVRNYDGSWNEWSRLPNAPIEK